MAPHTGTAIILGAGPAGLATGFALARANWSVQVYEMAHQVGGLARTVEKNGFRFDIGGHRWFTKKDELNYFLIDLLADELILVNRISRIFFDGKYVEYPLRSANVLTQLSPVTSIRAVGDFLVSQADHWLNRTAIVSMEDAYVAQFGRTLYDLFFKRYSEKVWGRDCSALSGDWVAQRSRGLSLFTAMRDALKGTDGKVESLVERFMYPRLGYGRISERMTEEIEPTGGKVHLGRRVVAVHHDRQRITSVTVSDGNHEEVVGGDVFVSSIPMTELTRILQPSADPTVLAATDQLTYRDLITVNLMLRRPEVTNDTWIYVHDPSLVLARLHEPRNWSPAMAPDGKTSLVLEYFCDSGDAIWQRSDDDMAELGAREVADKLHFIELGEVEDAMVVRNRDAYPRYGLGYRQAVDAVKQYLRSFPNLSIVGRGGTFRYNNADHAIETGLLAARNILGDSVDVDGVNSEQEYLEKRRVSAREVGRPNGAAGRLREFVQGGGS